MKKLLLMLLFVMFVGLASATWTNNTFNNSLTNETLTFTGNQNITRYLSIPDTVISLTIGTLNITGYGYAPVTDLGIPLSLSAATAQCDGFEIKTNKAITIINITNYASSTATGCRLLSGFNGTVLASGTYSSHVCTLSNYNLTAGTTYVVCSTGGTLYYQNGVSAQSGTNLNFTGTGCYSTNGVDNCDGQVGGQPRDIINITSIVTNNPNTPVNTSLFIGNSNTSINLNANGTVPVSTIANVRALVQSYMNATYLVGSYYLVPFNFYSNEAGRLLYSMLNFSDSGVLENSVTYNSSTYETSLENFVLNVSSGTTITSASLIWNGTSYTASISGSNPYIITKSLDIPTGAGTKNVYWSLTNSEGTFTTTNNQQSVANMNLTLCGSAPQNVPYVNFTFKNETAGQQSVSASWSNTWTYYLGSGTVNKTYAFTNTSENPSYAFCFSPQNRTVYALSGTITYDNGESDARAYSNSFILSNSTNNTVLWLLPSSSALAVSFQVVDGSNSPINGVLVTASRSGYGVVEAKYTDSSGIVTMFLDPTATYTITASKTGYSTFSESITPTQSSYTINLGTGSLLSSFPSSDLSKGINYLIKPSEKTLFNQTTYSFNFTINSSYWTITQFGFTLYDARNTAVGSANSTNNGGIVNYNLNTGINSTIKMRYFYIVNGTTVYESTTWRVTDLSKTGYSINNLKNRLILYINNGGLFGLTPLSLNIIVFLIIITTAGVFGYKFGLDRPILVIGLILGLVIIFDGILGFITYSSPLPDKTATITMVIIFIGALIREVI